MLVQRFAELRVEVNAFAGVLNQSDENPTQAEIAEAKRHVGHLKQYLDHLERHLNNLCRLKQLLGERKKLQQLVHALDQTQPVPDDEYGLLNIPDCHRGKCWPHDEWNGHLCKTLTQRYANLPQKDE